MRLAVFSLLFLCCASILPAADEQRSANAAARAWPLWDGKESVADYAKRVNLPPTETLDLGSNVKLELVLIPAGKFIMGTPEPVPVDEAGFKRKIITGQALLAASAGALLVMLAVVIVRAIRRKRRPQLSLGLLVLVTVTAGGCVLSGLHWRHSVQALETAKAEYELAKARYARAEPEEKPAHPVTITQLFYMGRFPVTQEQYQQVMGTNPSHFKGMSNPVETVAWDDAQAFCKKMTEQTKQAVRLPTEGEWEFACRAGTRTIYHSGDTDADLGRVAWYSANSNNTTHPVGQKEANAFGLYDMHGNVMQWCQDRYDEDYYGKSEAENPQGPAQDAFCFVMRGGAWEITPVGCRSARRGWSLPADIRDNGLGFRIVVPCATKTP